MCFILIVVIAQAQRNAATRKVAIPTKTAMGLIYFVDSGQGAPTWMFKTTEGILEVLVTNKNRVVNFPVADSAWNLGAEWSVT